MNKFFLLSILLFWSGMNLHAQKSSPKDKVKEVNVVVVYVCPATGTAEGNIAAVREQVDKAAAGCKQNGRAADIIVLAEMAAFRWLPGTVAEKAEPEFTGPFFKEMQKAASTHHCYIVFNMDVHRKNGKIYRANYMLGRKGEVIAKYDKLNVPPGELKSGITPGADNKSNVRPIKTEFGNIGMLICFDVDRRVPCLPETMYDQSPARDTTRTRMMKRLADAGAQLVLVSSIGDYTRMVAEEARENNIWAVHAGIQGYANNVYPKSMIVKPDGSVLAGIGTDGQVGGNGSNTFTGYVNGIVTLSEPVKDKKRVAMAKTSAQQGSAASAALSEAVYSPIKTVPPIPKDAMPELPRIKVDTKMALDSKYLVEQLKKPAGQRDKRFKYVAPGDNLTVALNETQRGDVLVLEAGHVYSGNNGNQVKLPKKDGEDWIYIVSSAYADLPGENTRITPKYADKMPKIINMNNPNYLSLETAAGAGFYRFMGIEFTHPENSKQSYSIVSLDVRSDSYKDTDLIDNYETIAIRNIVFDRCYIHGSNNTGDFVRGIWLFGTKNIGVVDCWIDQIHHTFNDTQSISGQNYLGLKIQNCYLEATGENIMLSGFGGVTPELTVGDVEIIGNHLYKPDAWNRFLPDHKRWRVKNIFELKSGQRILVDGNILENNWKDSDQWGYGILFTNRSDNNKVPHSTIKDVTFTNNLIINSSGGFQIAGLDNGLYGVPNRNILIQNNLILINDYSTNVDPFPSGDATEKKEAFQLVSKVDNLIIDHNTIVTGGSNKVSIMQGTHLDDTYPGYRYTNNISTTPVRNQMGNHWGIYSGYEGTLAVRNLSKDGIIAGNVFAGLADRSELYPEGNYFPENDEDIMFNDDANKDYRLALNSIYRDASLSTDGSLLGADIEQIYRKTRGVAFYGDKVHPALRNLAIPEKRLYTRASTRVATVSDERFVPQGADAGAEKGNAYFIAPDGNDNNVGTIGRPWKTFMYATLQLRAGDVLYVRGGDYTGIDAISTIRPYDEAIDGLRAQSIYENGTLGNQNVWHAPSSVSRHPYNSGLFHGTEDAPITIKAYRDEKPVLTLITPEKGSNSLNSLYGASYWVIDGLTFLDCGYTNENASPNGQDVFQLYKSDHITIQNCIFDNRDDVPFRKEVERRSIYFIRSFWCSNITVRNCYFHGCGYDMLHNGSGDGVLFAGSDYILIEDNYFGNCSHSAIATGGMFLDDTRRWFYRDFDPFFGSYVLPEQGDVESGARVIIDNYKFPMYVICQNNIVDNHYGGGIYIGGQHVVIQNNIVYHAGHQVDYVKSGMFPNKQANIYRHNIIVAANYEDKGPNEFLPVARPSVWQDGVGMTGYLGAGLSHNHFDHKLYNNIVYRSGWTGLYLAEAQQTKIRNLTFKNNIFLENNERQGGAGKPQHWDTPPAEILFSIFAHQEGYENRFPFGNNFFNNIIKSKWDEDTSLISHIAAGIGESFNKSLKQVEADYPWGFADNLQKNPLFVAPAPMPAVPMQENFYLDDYHLQPTSPAIDAGADLTYITEAGKNLTVVKVEDAGYFCDGFGLVPGDPVKIGANPVARIVKVDYKNNTLTLTKPVRVKKGDCVNLPFNGSRPDIGAYQYDALPEILVDNLELKDGMLTVLGIITTDWGKVVTVQASDNKGQIVYVKQTKSSNSGSFRFEIPLPQSGTYTLAFSGTDVKKLNVLTYKY